jgi:hypothetical protein
MGMLLKASICQAGPFELESSIFVLFYQNLLGAASFTDHLSCQSEQKLTGLNCSVAGHNCRKTAYYLNPDS